MRSLQPPHSYGIRSVGGLATTLRVVLSLVGLTSLFPAAELFAPAAALAMSMAPSSSDAKPRRTIQVVVWSDLACPWCYVGQKRLAQGISMFQREQVENADSNRPLVDVLVEWMPYMIDPGTDTKGEDMEAYCRRRWGGSGWTHHLRQEGSKSGATFRNWRWWPHTGLAHQWVQYGKHQHGASTDRMNSILFEALYESGQNLSSLDVLLDLARHNFPEWNVDELRSYLEENRGWGAVQDEIHDGRRHHRVSSVPYFVIGTDPSSGRNDESRRTCKLSGAQSAATFCEIFRDLSESEGTA